MDHLTKLALALKKAGHSQEVQELSNLIKKRGQAEKDSFARNRARMLLLKMTPDEILDAMEYTSGGSDFTTILSAIEWSKFEKPRQKGTESGLEPENTWTAKEGPWFEDEESGEDLYTEEIAPPIPWTGRAEKREDPTRPMIPPDLSGEAPPRAVPLSEILKQDEEELEKDELEREV